MSGSKMMSQGKLVYILNTLKRKTTYQNLWEAGKIVLGVNFIVLNDYVGKRKGLKKRP